MIISDHDDYLLMIYVIHVNNLNSTGQTNRWIFQLIES